MKRLLTLPWSIFKGTVGLTWAVTKALVSMSWAMLKFFLKSISYAFDIIEDTAVFVTRVGIGILVMGFLMALFAVIIQKSSDFERVEGLPALKMSETARNVSQVNRPMIRLMYGDRFKCSGVVISDTYALTAAHCVQKAGGGSMDTSPISIRNDDDQITGVTANPVAMYKSQDVALLKGDFSSFMKVPIETDPRGMFASPGPFMACGFPGGDRSVCMPFKPVTNSEFLVMGAGFLFKGMSGGPVIDTTTGRVVAVNSRVGVNAVMVGPLIGFMADAGVKVEE